MIHGYRNENWKEIQFDAKISEKEKYKVSNYGRMCRFKNGAYEKPKDVFSIIEGYYCISVLQHHNGKQTKRYVHRLLALEFLPKAEDEIFVIHLDYDKLNNHVDNLKWATKREKELHQFKNPVFIEAVKNKRVKYKLDEGKVKIIKRKLASTKSKTRLRMIAKQFGVSDMQIHRIKTGENWGHVTIDD